MNDLKRWTCFLVFFNNINGCDCSLSPWSHQACHIIFHKHVPEVSSEGGFVYLMMNNMFVIALRFYLDQDGGAAVLSSQSRLYSTSLLVLLDFASNETSFHVTSTLLLDSRGEQVPQTRFFHQNLWLLLRSIFPSRPVKCDILLKCFLDSWSSLQLLSVSTGEDLLFLKKVLSVTSGRTTGTDHVMKNKSRFCVQMWIYTTERSDCHYLMFRSGVLSPQLSLT